MIVYIYNIGVDLYNGFNGLRHRINWTYFTVLDGLAHPLYSCYNQIKLGSVILMGGICVVLLMLFCAIWILCMLFLSIFIPLLVVYNGIVGIAFLVVYFILKKKQFFTKYTEGYKYILSRILKYGLLIFGIVSIIFAIILAILLFC